MNELKPIPSRITKSKIYEMYSGEKACDVSNAIRIAKQHINKDKYNKNDQIVNYREFKYVVAQLDNPRGFVKVLEFQEQKELQKEIEND